MVTETGLYGARRGLDSEYNDRSLSSSWGLDSCYRFLTVRGWTVITKTGHEGTVRGWTVITTTGHEGVKAYIYFFILFLQWWNALTQRF